MQKLLAWLIWIVAVVSLIGAFTAIHAPKAHACEQPNQCAAQYYWDSPLLK